MNGKEELAPLIFMSEPLIFESFVQSKYYKFRISLKINDILRKETRPYILSYSSLGAPVIGKFNLSDNLMIVIIIFMHDLGSNFAKRLVCYRHYTTALAPYSHFWSIYHLTLLSLFQKQGGGGGKRHQFEYSVIHAQWEALALKNIHSVHLSFSCPVLLDLPHNGINSSFKRSRERIPI